VGLPPALSFLDATREALSGLLRAGNAGSNTAADHITVLDQALAQIPDAHRHGSDVLIVATRPEPVTPSTGKDSGFGRFPSRQFAINAAWLELALVGIDLLAWTRVLLLDSTHALAEPKKLRYRVWYDTHLRRTTQRSRSAADR
jgi:hypothetical protein